MKDTCPKIQCYYPQHDGTNGSRDLGRPPDAKCIFWDQRSQLQREKGMFTTKKKSYFAYGTRLRGKINSRGVREPGSSLWIYDSSLLSRGQAHKFLTKLTGIGVRNSELFQQHPADVFAEVSLLGERWTRAAVRVPKKHLDISNFRTSQEIPTFA